MDAELNLSRWSSGLCNPIPTSIWVPKAYRKSTPECHPWVACFNGSNVMGGEAFIRLETHFPITLKGSSATDLVAFVIESSPSECLSYSSAIGIFILIFFQMFCQIRNQSAPQTFHLRSLGLLLGLGLLIQCCSADPEWANQRFVDYTGNFPSSQLEDQHQIVDITVPVRFSEELILSFIAINQNLPLKTCIGMCGTAHFWDQRRYRYQPNCQGLHWHRHRLWLYLCSKFCPTFEKNPETE